MDVLRSLIYNIDNILRCYSILFNDVVYYDPEILHTFPKTCLSFDFIH